MPLSDGYTIKKNQQNSSTSNDEFAMPAYALTKYPFFNTVIENKGLGTVVAGRELSEEEESIKLKFRWDGCDRLLGICITIPINNTAEKLSGTDETTTGTAVIKLRENILYLKPSKRIFFTGGTVPVSQDVDLGTEVAKKFGVKKLIIEKGLYKMDFSNDKTNGEVYLNVKTK